MKLYKDCLSDDAGAGGYSTHSIGPVGCLYHPERFGQMETFLEAFS